MEKSPRPTALYYRVIDAFRAKFPEGISPDDQEYKDLVAACEACFLAILHPGSVRPEEMIRHFAKGRDGYSCWRGDAKAAMQTADLSFLEDPDVLKAELRAACNMAMVWIWYLEDQRFSPSELSR